MGQGQLLEPLNLYDTSVKVPCIFSMPGTLKENTVSDSLLSQYDFMPTLLDFVGIHIPDAAALPGRSFLPELTGKSHSEYHDAVHVFDEYGSSRMVHTKEWKYIHRYPYGPHELYDLKHDPGERFNLLSENRFFLYGPQEIQAKVNEMRKVLEDWFDRYVDPDKDGKSEPICGRGQLCKVGKASNGKLTFHPHVAVEYSKK